MKNYFLSAFIMLFTAIGFSQTTYMVEVYNYTNIAHEVNVEIGNNCDLAAGGSGVVEANTNRDSPALIPVTFYNETPPNQLKVLWAGANAMCNGEISAALNNAPNCFSQPTRTGDASCIGRYNIGIAYTLGNTPNYRIAGILSIH